MPTATPEFTRDVVKINLVDLARCRGHVRANGDTDLVATIDAVIGEQDLAILREFEGLSALEARPVPVDRIEPDADPTEKTRAEPGIDSIESIEGGGPGDSALSIEDLT